MGLLTLRQSEPVQGVARRFGKARRTPPPCTFCSQESPWFARQFRADSSFAIGCSAPTAESGFAEKAEKGRGNSNKANERRNRAARFARLAQLTIRRTVASKLRAIGDAPVACLFCLSFAPAFVFNSHHSADASLDFLL